MEVSSSNHVIRACMRNTPQSFFYNQVGFFEVNTYNWLGFESAWRNGRAMNEA